MTITSFFVLFVAIEHIYIMILEMFLWTKPRTLKIFAMDIKSAEISKPLAANQGLYNGFLSAGLIWGLSHQNDDFGIQIQVFFLLCVCIAAIFGSITAKKSILYVQGLPAAIALLSLFINNQV